MLNSWTARATGRALPDLLALASLVAALALWATGAGMARADRWGPPWESEVVVDRAVVCTRPDRASAPVGPLSRGAFVAVTGEARGPDGSPWVAIPDGFVPAGDLREFRYPWTAEVTLSSVSVYALPYPASGIRRTAARGDLLRVTGLANGLEGDTSTWWATTEGFVPLGAVRWATSDWAGWWQMPPAAEAPGGWWGAISGRARVRVAPSVEAPVVGMFSGGERVKVLAEEEGSPLDGSSIWYRIDGGRFAGGRVHGSVVRRLPEPGANSSPLPGDSGATTWIVVDRSAATLTVVKEGKPIFSTYVSIGLAGAATPTGVYSTFGKFRGDRMSSRNVANPTHPYDLPNVPNTQYYLDGGYAIHGTYWHDSFGLPESQGCINLTWTDSEYLFGLTEPALSEQASERWATGVRATPVLILD